MEDIVKAVTVILVAVIIWCFLSLILALPVMWLWNWLMPVLFKVGTITWLQAWGLSMLCSFLFKGTITVNK